MDGGDPGVVHRPFDGKAMRPVPQHQIAKGGKLRRDRAGGQAREPHQRALPAPPRADLRQGEVAKLVDGQKRLGRVAGGQVGGHREGVFRRRHDKAQPGVVDGKPPFGKDHARAPVLSAAGRLRDDQRRKARLPGDRGDVAAQALRHIGVMGIRRGLIRAIRAAQRLGRHKGKRDTVDEQRLVPMPQRVAGILDPLQHLPVRRRLALGLGRRQAGAVARHRDDRRQGKTGGAVIALCDRTLRAGRTVRRVAVQRGVGDVIGEAFGQGPWDSAAATAEMHRGQRQVGALGQHLAAAVLETCDAAPVEIGHEAQCAGGGFFQHPDIPARAGPARRRMRRRPMSRQRCSRPGLRACPLDGGRLRLPLLVVAVLAPALRGGGLKAALTEGGGEAWDQAPPAPLGEIGLDVATVKQHVLAVADHRRETGRGQRPCNRRLHEEAQLFHPAQHDR